MKSKKQKPWEKNSPPRRFIEGVPSRAMVEKSFFKFILTAMRVELANVREQ